MITAGPTMMNRNVREIFSALDMDEERMVEKFKEIYYVSKLHIKDSV